MKMQKFKTKNVVLSTETLRGMKPDTSVTLSNDNVKTSTLRSTASKLKKEGYLFRISDKGMKNKTIVECLKTPES